MKNRKQIPSKIKALLQKEINSECPFPNCMNKDVDQFEFHHIDKNPENNNIQNILMLCPTCHSKITKGDIKHDKVKEIKIKVNKPKPKIPEKFKNIAEEAILLRNMFSYEKAKTLLEDGISKAKKANDELSESYFNYYLSIIIDEKFKKPDKAEELVKKSVEVFKKYNANNLLAIAYNFISRLEMNKGNITQAKSYINKAILINTDEKNIIELASNYQEIGWIEHYSGNYQNAISEYKQGLTLLLSEKIKDDDRLNKKVQQMIAGFYSHLGISYNCIGDVYNTKECFLKSVEFFRKCSFKFDLAKSLYSLADTYFKEGEYKEGDKYLDEAIELYSEIKEVSELARCLDLKGRLNYTLGNEKKAVEIFTLCCELLEKAGQKDALLEELYSKLGEFNLRNKEVNKALEYFSKLELLSESKKDSMRLADALSGLAKVESAKGNIEEHKKLLSEAIKVLLNSLNFIESDERKAYVIGTIAHYYEQAGNLQESLHFFSKAKYIYEQKKSVSGIARCLGGIAGVYHLLGRKNEAFDTIRTIKKIVDGTPYYELIAGSAIDLGKYQRDLGNFEEAKVYFQEAEFLSNKYNLHFKQDIKALKEGINELIKIRKPPEINFEDLLKDLFDFIAWFPEARESIFRMWFYCRRHEIFSNLKSLYGVKLMICENDVAKFSNYVNAFYVYTDIALQVVSDDFSATAIDMVPFPKDKIIYPNIAVLEGENLDGIITYKYLRGSIESRYTLCAGNAKSDITGNEGVIVMGWAPGLPPQAYELILKSNPIELLQNKTFFFPHERHKAHDKLLSDIYIAKDYEFIPLYINKLPESENVGSIKYSAFKLPVFALKDEQHFGKTLLRLKNNLIKLLSATKGKWDDIITNFKIEVEEINRNSKATNSYLNLQLHLLEYLGTLEKETYSVLILK